MAVIDKAMGSLNPDDVEGSFQRMQDYIAYLIECVEQQNNIMAARLSALEEG